MPVPLIAQGVLDGVDSIAGFWTGVKVVIWVGVLYLLKTYFGGARATAERNMHSKVVMITGGTSGIGAAVARELAQRGAQLVLLTQHSLSDPFLQDYILDLRTTANNELITAVECDLASLHSIRTFATKWVDNAPPRRLDAIILCANTMTPKGSRVRVSEDGLESNFAVNYLANFHLLSILSPAIRAQPPDRDVRVIFTTCSSYMGGVVPDKVPRPALPSSEKEADLKEFKITNPAAAYATSKLLLMIFASAFQKHLDAYERPDKQPMLAKVVTVDPGWSRTPSMRRWLTGGSLLGLFLYLISWPFWWLVLKSPVQGAQSILHAAMEEEFSRTEGGRFIKEVMDGRIMRDEIADEAVQKKVWGMSEKAIEILEKEGAVKRALLKKEKEKMQESGKAAEQESTPVTTATPETSEKKPSRRSKKAAKA